MRFVVCNKHHTHKVHTHTHTHTHTHSIKISKTERASEPFANTLSRSVPAHMVNCSLIDNQADNGGAIAADQIVLDSCVLDSNSASKSGGAVTAYRLCTIAHSTFSSNEATISGGAVVMPFVQEYLLVSPVLFVRNSSFLYNVAGTDVKGSSCNTGGAIAIESSFGFLYNVVLLHNSACSGAALWASGATTQQDPSPPPPPPPQQHQPEQDQEQAETLAYFQRCQQLVRQQALAACSSTSATTNNNIVEHSLIVRDSTFAFNSASNYGSAMTLVSSVASIEHSQINDNLGSSGGAIYVTSSLLNVSTTVMSSNSASNGGGGAVYLSNSHFTCTNCSVFANTASANGGAIYANSPTVSLHEPRTQAPLAPPDHDDGDGAHVHRQAQQHQEPFEIHLYNCSFHDNRASISGGALFIMSDSNITSYVELCTFANNKATSGAALIVAGGNVEHCLFELNNASAIKGGVVNVNISPSTTLSIASSLFRSNQGGPGALYNALSIGAGTASSTRCTPLAAPDRLLVTNTNAQDVVSIMLADSNSFLDTPMPADGLMLVPAPNAVFQPPTSNLTIQAVDYCGANLTVGGGSQALSVTATPGSIKASIVDNGNGLYHAVLQLLTVQQYSATLYVNGMRSVLSSKAISFSVQAGTYDTHILQLVQYNPSLRH
jgi:predicted outer membrane repeat protein